MTPDEREGNGKSPEEPRDPDDLELEEDFLDDLDVEIEEVITAPTEEYKVPGAEEPSADDPAHPVGATPGGHGGEAEEPPVDAGEEVPGDVEDEQPPVEEGEEEEEHEEEEEALTEEPIAEADDDGEEEEEEGEKGEEREEGEEEEEAERPTEVVAATAGQAPPALGPDDFGRPRWRFPLWLRFLTASVLIVGTVAAATAASLILYLDDIASALGHNEALASLAPELEAVDGGAPQTILIVGSDKRLGGPHQGGYGLSDTSILLRLDPDRKAIAVFSIPRDLVVSIPGRGTAKFNEAFSLGGPKLTLQTVKALTGLKVNHLVNINFTGFAKAVNAIGCVYVDVDRRYYHSNQGLAGSAQYAEINVRPGYQRLCGYKALEYVRFRHTDNDIVRAARQQDFLREARARVPADKLFNDRKELIHIFTQFTTSDIRDSQTMLQVLKLFIEARDEQIKEIHFPGTVGPQVTVAPGQIEQAVSQFLGIEGTAGPRGNDVTPAGSASPAPETPAKGGKPTGAPAAPAPKGKKKKRKAAASTSGLEGGSFGKKLALRIARINQGMAIYYPTTVIAGSDYDQRPRAYRLQDHSLSRDETLCYKFTLKTPSGEYYGLQGTQWTDAPILSEPHETRKIGDREYKLYYDNDRLRMVAWEDKGTAFWVSNTLLQSLTADQMIAIARGAKLLPGTPAPAPPAPSVPAK